MTTPNAEQVASLERRLNYANNIINETYNHLTDRRNQLLPEAVHNEIHLTRLEKDAAVSLLLDLQQDCIKERKRVRFLLELLDTAVEGLDEHWVTEPEGVKLLNAVDEIKKMAQEEEKGEH